MPLNAANLLKDFLKLPEIREVLANPDKYPHISSGAVEKWKDMMASVLKEGIKGEIIKNLVISTYDPFTDGVASQVVGKAKFEVACVVKAGGKDIKEQNDFMKRFSASGFFPEVLNDGQIDGNYICLMENLAGYKSFHEYIFKTEAGSKEEIKIFLGHYYQWLGEIYLYYRAERVPILNKIYLESRLIKRIEEARTNFKGKGVEILSLDLETLLKTRIVLEGEELRSFDEVMVEILHKRDEIQELAPAFSTFVHGDAHPANIMILKQPPHYDIKFIDPNPSLGGSSDYIYDQGKMFHWLDMMGFAVLERAFNEKIFTFECEKKPGLLSVNYKWLDPRSINLPRVKDFQSYAFERAMACLSSLADSFKDATWKKRLYLSVASAYLGGLPRLEDPNHLALLFVRGLSYLNKFVKE